MCGDVSIDCLTDNDKKRQLDAELLTYNLSVIVYFPTRSQGYSNTTIDNIFTDTYKFINFTVSLLHNGLLDHDAQVLKNKWCKSSITKPSYLYHQKYK